MVPTFNIKFQNYCDITNLQTSVEFKGSNKLKGKYSIRIFIIDDNQTILYEDLFKGFNWQCQSGNHKILGIVIKKSFKIFLILQWLS